MQNWVDILKKNEHILKVRLRSQNILDPSIFERFQQDDLCIRCMIDDFEKGILAYSIEGFISLDEFLKQVSFEDEEGYLFLDKLFTLAVSCSRDKPILFDPDFVYVSYYGDDFRFIGLPLKIDEWMLQKESCRMWVEYLTNHFKTKTAYEIPGYLISFLKSDEFSLPNLILALQALRYRYYPKKFRIFHKKQVFRLKEPVLYKPSFANLKSEALPSNEKTQLLGNVNEINAYLERNGTKYPLIAETILIGRSMACDIRLEDKEISLKHAKILYQSQRYYIQDLHSSNHTYLNGKCVQRKMRLKDGMTLHFGHIEFIFHQ